MPDLLDMMKNKDAHFRVSADAFVNLYHHATKGAKFEETVRDLFDVLLPEGGLAVSTGLLGHDQHKQIDLIVHPPTSKLQRQSGVFSGSLLSVVGEVKWALRSEHFPSLADIAEKVHASRPDQRVPLVVVARTAKCSSGRIAERTAELLERVEPATFVFDGSPVSVVPVGADRPIRAWSSDGELDGMLIVNSAELPVSAVLYLWLWAVLAEQGLVPTLNYIYLREFIEAELQNHQIRATLISSGTSAKEVEVSLSLPSVDITVQKRSFDAEKESTVQVPLPATPSARQPLGSERKVMLIGLGQWVDNFDSWDESPWGGPANAARSGYGFREAMSEQELLDAARLFWRFNPLSGNWDGVEYAVVVHQGVTRAVIRIEQFIGPLWGRHGFQGQVEHNPELTNELVGRTVPSSQNPVRTWPPRF